MHKWLRQKGVVHLLARRMPFASGIRYYSIHLHIKNKNGRVFGT